MDKDLKDVLIYGGGTLFGYSAFLTFILQLTKDVHLIIIDTLLLIILLWLMFIQIKLNKRRGYKDE